MVFFHQSSLRFFLGAICLLGVGSIDRAIAQDPFDAYCNLKADFDDFDLPQTCIDVAVNPELGTVQTRCYHVYVPEGCSGGKKKKKVPVVLDVHGLSSCPAIHSTMSGWKQKADEECFVVVYPNGQIPEESGYDASCWNLHGGAEAPDPPLGSGRTTMDRCCCAENGEYTSDDNDSIFLKAVIDDIIDTFDHPDVKVDEERVYMAGHSNGCTAGFSMAANYPESIAAVCCHAGTFLTPIPDDNLAVPIWLVYGMFDQVMPFDGLEAFGAWPTLEVFQYFARQNGCVMEGDSFEQNEVFVDDQLVGYTLKISEGCENGASVELMMLITSGHTPFLLPDDVHPVVIEAMQNRPIQPEMPTAVDTTASAWEFCSAHKRKKGKAGKASKAPKAENRRLRK